MDVTMDSPPPSFSSTAYRRPWEAARSATSVGNHAPSLPTLPSIATLTSSMPSSVIENSDQMEGVERDSGNWSLPRSTRSSTYSFAAGHSPANGKHQNVSGNGYHQSASSLFPQSAAGGSNGAGAATVNTATARCTPPSAGPGDPPHTPSKFTPSPQDQLFPSINHNLDPQSSIHPESRRSSTDSRMNQGISSLTLNGFHNGSNFPSTNASQVSFASSGRQRERGMSAISNGEYSLRPSRSNNTMYTNDASHTSMNAHRASCGTCLSESDYRDCEASSSVTTVGSEGKHGPRIAPTIAENPQAEIYNAEIPTRGKAYAFPDPIVGPVTPSSGTGSSRRPDSSTRRSSINLFTGEDSVFPPSLPDAPRDSQPAIHNKQVRNLIGDPVPPAPALGNTFSSSTSALSPYSRTPELRVSHKLAERKRRSEMKDCFEMLRAKLPTHQSNKSSKWETLTKSIDYIESLERRVTENREWRAKVEDKHESEVKALHRKMESLQNHMQEEINELRAAFDRPQIASQRRHQEQKQQHQHQQQQHQQRQRQHQYEQEEEELSARRQHQSSSHDSHHFHSQHRHPHPQHVSMNSSRNIMPPSRLSFPAGNSSNQSFPGPDPSRTLPPLIQRQASGSSSMQGFRYN